MINLLEEFYQAFTFFLSKTGVSYGKTLRLTVYQQPSTFHGDKSVNLVNYAFIDTTGEWKYYYVFKENVA